ncbi:MAG: ATP-dependent DNA ligase, partial [Proteobacteria bacterium]|nr:ATP-dependent DNA ligase [Pseudomonadota bacterium]
MKDFARLFTRIDQSTKTSVKVAALAEYFATAPDADRLWTIALFSGRRPRRAVTTTRLREWAAEAAGHPLWLFEEAYPVVGDLAETIALFLPPCRAESDHGLTNWINILRGISDVDEAARKDAVLSAWNELDTTSRFLFNKLITSGFRIGISQTLMTRALAQATGREEAELAHRLMGAWSPDDTTFHALIEADDPTTDASRPYPFCLAHGLDTAPGDLGAPEDWMAGWAGL